MLSQTLIAAAFASLAVASPVRRDDSNFILLTLDSGSGEQFAPINANDQLFWIGKDPSSYCPLTSGCPPGNVTALAAAVPSDGGVAMDVEVPGGQSVYVAADGALGYTIAHSGVVPTGGTGTGFVYDPTAINQDIGLLTFDGKSFAACPAGAQGVYQIYAIASPGFTQTGCLSIEIGTESYSGIGAWEY